MPTYEYRCKACGHEFERFQGITQKPVRRCPSCGRNTVQRLIGTGAGIIFKGSGFYQTDYRSKAYSEKARSESSAAGGGEPAKGSCPAAAGKECAAGGGSCKKKK
jgi:putative FmdB family regulatory protein